MNKKSVLIVHRYFWPQNYPYATMLKAIAEQLSTSGLAVAVCSTHENGSGQLENRSRWCNEHGITCLSFPRPSERNFSIFRKILSASSYVAWVFYSALKSDARLIWVASTPPVIMPFILRVARLFRDFRIVYHCQDIHPEAMLINNNLKPGLLYKLLRKIDGFNVRGSDAVIVLSDDMRRTLLARGGISKNIHVINNFVISPLAKVPAQVNFVGNLKGERLFVFTGSLGRFQNLEFMLNVFKNVATQVKFNLLFVGDGPMASILKKRVKDLGLQNVHFVSHQPIENALAAMDAADYGVVSLSPGVEQVAYPSKSIMYLSRGLPVVAFVSEGCDLGKMLVHENAGFPVEVSGRAPEVVAKSLVSLLRKFESHVVSREAIKANCLANFSEQVIVPQYVRLVNELL